MCKICAWVHGDHIVDPWEDAAAAAGSDITSVCPELSLAASPARPRLAVESAGCFALLCSDLQSLLAGWAAAGLLGCWAAGLAWAGLGWCEAAWQIEEISTNTPLLPHNLDVFETWWVQALHWHWYVSIYWVGGNLFSKLLIDINLFLLILTKTEYTNNYCQIAMHAELVALCVLIAKIETQI